MILQIGCKIIQNMFVLRKINREIYVIAVLSYLGEPTSHELLFGIQTLR